MVQSWNNPDGLYRKYGTDAAGPSTAGEYSTLGPDHIIEFTLDLTKLGTASAVVDGTDNVSIPANAIIEKIDVVTKTAATGTGALLNLGLVKRDRSTAIDADGLLAVFPQTSMAAVGQTTSLTEGSTDAGALVGTTVGTNPGYLAADYDTAAFTAGVALVRIYYRFD